MRSWGGQLQIRLKCYNRLAKTARVGTKQSQQLILFSLTQQTPHIFRNSRYLSKFSLVSEIVEVSS
jgi:hypothetical protein